MEVENQEHFEEGIGEQKQLDTSEETEDGLMEQRGDDALEHQDDGVVDKEVVGATESLGDMAGQEDVELSTKQVSELEEENRGVVPADLEVKVHVPKEEGCSEEDAEQNQDPEQDDSGTENEDNAGDRKPAELELMVHVPKEVGFDAKEKDEPEDKGDDDKVTDLDEERDADVAKNTDTGRVATDLELLVHNPDNDAEKNSETGRLAADLDLNVLDPDKETEKISEIPKEPEIQKVPADLELRVDNADTDSEKPKSGKEPAELELLVQKDENDNDDNVEPAEIHRNGDLKTQEKPETEIKAKAKAKAGSVKNSIAKFNNKETKKDKGMFITVQPDKCSACERTVYAMEKLEMNKNIYHRGCFKCSHCSATLTAKTFSINEGVIYCTTHFKQLFARKGNYDEGFGRQQYKKKWVEDQLKNKDATA